MIAMPGAGSSRLAPNSVLAMLAVVIALCAFVALPAAAVVAQGTAEDASTAAATESPDAGRGAPDGGTELPDAAAGLRIYSERCSECHGPMGRGLGLRAPGLPAPPRSFADADYMRSAVPSDSFAVLTEGRTDKGMPAWDGVLSEKERWDALYGAWSYYYTPDRLARGREVWRQQCAACHDPSGDVAAEAGVPGTAEGEPSALHPWPEDRLLDISQDEIVSATRSVGDAHGSVAEMSEEELLLAIDYARSTTFDALPFDDLEVGGEIVGRVVNGTDATLGSKGAMLRIVPFAGSVPGADITATVDAEGLYTATGLVAGPGLVYRVIVSYGGADEVYDEPIVLSAGEPARVDFTVYESATDVELQTRVAHIVLSPEPDRGTVRAIEMWVVSNPTSRTLVADGGGTVRLELPDEASGIAIDDPRLRARASLQEGALVLRAPMQPGEHEVAISYDLPYSGGELAFERTIDLPTDELSLIVADGGASIEGESLTSSEKAEMGGQDVVMASATQLQAGEKLRARITGLPTSEPQEGAAMPLPEAVLDPQWVLALGLGLMLLGVAVAAAYPLIATRRAPGRRRRRLEARYERLIGQIADLDDRYSAAALDDAEYREHRARLMGRAMALRRRLDTREGQS